MNIRVSLILLSDIGLRACRCLAYELYLLEQWLVVAQRGERCQTLP